jgi:hypothetical protein
MTTIYSYWNDRNIIKIRRKLYYTAQDSNSKDVLLLSRSHFSIHIMGKLCLIYAISSPECLGGGGGGGKQKKLEKKNGSGFFFILKKCFF